MLETGAGSGWKEGSERSIEEGPILLALDGTAGSLAAARVANLLAHRWDTGLEAISAVEVPIPPDEGLVPDEVRREIRDSGLRSRWDHLEAQVSTLPRWRAGRPAEVRAGPPGRVIIEAAERLGASLIVTGLGRRRPIDRFLGSSVPTSVVRLSTVPVLAVQRDRSDLPEELVAAVDFSTFSRRAVCTLPRLASARARIHLLHVATLPLMGRSEWNDEYRRRATDRLGELAHALESQGTPPVSTRVLAGDPATAILGYGRDRGADLIAVGSHGHSFVNRSLLGTVSGKLLRAADCSVLVVPPRDRGRVK